MPKELGFLEVRQTYIQYSQNQPFQHQVDFRKKKKKFFMNWYSEESFYATEMSLETFSLAK